MGKPPHKDEGIKRRRGLFTSRQYGPRRRQGARPTPAPPVADNARAIAALRIDGGTAYGAWTDPSSWSVLFRSFFDAFTSIVDPVELEKLRRNPPLVTMPLPQLASRQRGLAGVLDTEQVDVRTRGFSSGDAPPVAEVRLGGRDGKFLVLHFHDRAHVQIGERLNVETGEVSHYIRVEAKHRELYADGLRHWMLRWLGMWSWHLFGTWVEPEKIDSVGWSQTQLHINSDFVGIEFDEHDESDFLGARKRELCGLLAEHDDYPEDAWETPWLQTVNLGRKSSDVMLCIYRKGDQLRQEKKLDPRKSAYAPLWLENGWEPEEDGDPTRVEFRLRKKGLQFEYSDDGEDHRAGEIAYDFRNPTLALDPVAVAHLWRHVAKKRRLVQRAWDCEDCDGSGWSRPPEFDELEGDACPRCEGKGKIECSRIERAPTDPRWRVVEGAANYQPDFDIRQVKHRVAELTRIERQTKSWRMLQSAARSIAMMDENLYVPHSSENLAAYLERLAARLRAGDVVDYKSTDTVPSPLDETADAMVAKCNFFGVELAEEPRTAYALDFLEQRGARGVSRAFKPPDEGEEDEDGKRNTGPPDARLDRDIPQRRRSARAG